MFREKNNKGVTVFSESLFSVVVMISFKIVKSCTYARALTS